MTNPQVTGLAGEDNSTSPQLGTQLGTDSHRCSYEGGEVVTPASSAAFSQLSGVTTGSPSPHVVDNPAGGAPCRPVDEASGCAQHPQPGGRRRPPSPAGDEGLPGRVG